MVQNYGNDRTLHNLLNIRTLAMALIAYAGFLRFSELAALQIKHLSFYPSHLVISIKSSKTDVYRQGNSVIIARSFLPTCPVTMLELYLSLAKLCLSDKDIYVFRNLKKVKEGYLFRSSNNPTSTRGHVRGSQTNCR